MIGHASGLLEGQINRSHQTLPLGGFEIPNHLGILEFRRKREGRYKSLCIKCVSNPGDQVYRRRLENPTLGGGNNEDQHKSDESNSDQNTNENKRSRDEV